MAAASQFDLLDHQFMVSITIITLASPALAIHWRFTAAARSLFDDTHGGTAQLNILNGEESSSASAAQN